MAFLNKIVLIGRLTNEPDVKVTTEGTSLAKFTLAVDRTFSSNNKTDFINVVSWDKLAEQADNYFNKGKMVLVEGRIQIRSFEDKEGDTQWTTEVVANHFRILDKKSLSKEPAKVSETEDDIPY